MSFITYWVSGVIFLATLFTNIQAQCAEGEPKLGQAQPDLNVTISPATAIPPGGDLTILCEAGPPRCVPLGTTPLPAVDIKVYVNDAISSECSASPSVSDCSVTFIGITGECKKIACVATNLQGGCRVKYAEVNCPDNETTNVSTNIPTTTPTNATVNMTTMPPTTGNMTMSPTAGNTTMAPTTGNATMAPTTGNATMAPTTANATTMGPTTADGEVTTAMPVVQTPTPTTSPPDLTVTLTALAAAVAALIAILGVIVATLKQQ